MLKKVFSVQLYVRKFSISKIKLQMEQKTVGYLSLQIALCYLYRMNNFFSKSLTVLHKLHFNWNKKTVGCLASRLALCSLFPFIHLHLPPFPFIHLHTPLSTFIYLHTCSFTFIHLHTPSYTFI